MPTSKAAKAAFNREYYKKNRAAIKAWQHEYYLENREQIIAYNKRYRKAFKNSSPENHIHTLLKSAKDRSEKRGMEFQIAAKDLLPAPQKCPLLGVKITYGSGAPKDRGPSIDRKDPAKGYVPGNVWIVSKRANRIKSDATLAELQVMTSRLTAECGTIADRCTGATQPVT